MAADRPDEFDVPSADRGDRSPDLSRSARFDRPEDSAERADADADVDVEVEARDRDSYYQQLRYAAWDEAVERFKQEWAEHRDRWPDESRERVDRSGDPEGSWRGDSGRFLDRAANAEVEERYQHIAETERDIVSPAMREIEACDPDRHLVGFDHRLKGLDRLKDKVAATLEEQPDLTSHEAIGDVPDCIRYTFKYDDAHYVEGVRDDIKRLSDQGFELVSDLKNSWLDTQYKGINSRWRVGGGEERFEVQFHTEISFDAKQLTHAAYERARNPLTTPAELSELRSFQREVTAQIPIPPESDDISRKAPR